MIKRHHPRLRPLALAAAALVAAGVATLPAVGAEPPAARMTNMTGAYLAARVASTERDIASAAAFYNMVLHGDPTNTGLAERTFLLWLSNGDAETASSLAREIIRFDESNEMARLTLAAQAVRAEHYEEAREHLAKIDGGPLSVLTTRLLTAWTLAAEGKATEALGTIAELTGPEWYKVFKDFHSGLIADMAGKTETALGFVRAAFAQDQSLQPATALAGLLARTGERDAAIKLIADYVGANGGQPTALALLAQLRSGGTPGPTITDADRGFAEVLYGIATALSGQGGAEVSVIYLQLALYADPENPLATLALGQLLQSMGRDADAIALFNRVPDGSPLHPTASIAAAVSLNTLERYDEATAELAPLVDTDPSDLASVITLGNIYRGQKDFREASDVYSKGIATIAEPTRDDWTIFYFRGITYERTDRWDQAEADFKKALELFPDQPQVLNYLGYSWIDKGLNYDEALAMIERAVEQRPDDGYIVDSLGWAHYKLGRYEEAVTELERAVQLMPSDPVLNDHLGDAYWKVGRKLEAMFQWSHARDLNPEPEDLPRIVQKLESGVPEDAPGKDG